MSEKFFQPKNPERLQAQTEVFSDEKLSKLFKKENAEILKYSFELSKIKDLNNLPSGLPEELVNLVHAHKDEYIAFLREEKRIETSFIENNIKNYKEKFQPIIANLKSKIGEDDFKRMGGILNILNNGNFKKLPEYLGSGNISSAFRVEMDGKKFAAKITPDASMVGFEIKPLIRAKGIPHTAQLEAYSMEDHVVIMNLLPGSSILEVSSQEIPEYPKEHISQLIDTMCALSKRGLKVDYNLSNYMYDKEKGFSILDYSLYGYNSLYVDILSLVKVLAVRKKENKNQSTVDSEKDYDKRYLRGLIEIIDILKDKHPEILSEYKQAQDKLEASGKERMNFIQPYIKKDAHFNDPEIEKYVKKLSDMGF